MRSFDILKRAVGHSEYSKEGNDIEALSLDLLTEIDAELTLEEYEEGDKVVDLCDKLEAELKDVDEEDEDDDEEEVDEDEEDDEDDEFEGIDEDDDDDEETK